MNIYKRAWEIFKERLDEKTGWGKEQLKILMAECLEQAVAEADSVIPY